ncbi:hypothetical protein [Paenibacillus alba]|uniref:Uncharacterized protein n=1 Tax=Paenibacillus alba TaxID=1197127 RepID=A0ABU6GCC3_9BACL|nr:hypothetical protein [Paenibacillus alba]MEC0231295.1 hypothetical protein [Paenibacillus alba]
MYEQVIHGQIEAIEKDEKEIDVQITTLELRKQQNSLKKEILLKVVSDAQNQAAAAQSTEAAVQSPQY